MGAWNVSISGNDTAQDLRQEYCAAFYKYDVNEALTLIDKYVREHMFDESDAEEWCNYYYSLAEFMWKKGILTDTVRDKAIGMIDSGFGLDIWAESGEKILKERKKKLAEFREKLLSPQPAKKKIKPNVHTEKIFTPGDVIAIQLQTVNKTYVSRGEKFMTNEEFASYDGKYILLQSVGCHWSWSSSIVPEVKDYWAHFKLFDGVYDSAPEDVDVQSLKEAKICRDNKILPVFWCESSMFYFKKRKYKIVKNAPLHSEYKAPLNHCIFFGIDNEIGNPDSQLLAAMGKELVCSEFDGTREELEALVNNAVQYGNFRYELSREENEKIFIKKYADAMKRIDDAIDNGGTVLSVSFSKLAGICTCLDGRIDNIYIAGRYRKMGFGTELIKYSIEKAGNGAYIDVPKDNKALLRICEKLGMKASLESLHGEVRMRLPQGE